MTAALRSTRARIGVTLLNLPAPGLGLVRIGATQIGLAWLAGPAALMLVLAAAAAILPRLTFPAYAAIAFGLIGALVIYLIAALVLTWRRSRTVVPPQWWARWYGLLLLYLAVSAAGLAGVMTVQNYYKLFYSPAEGMAPTLLVGDTFLSDMHDRSPPRRGDIVIFATPTGDWIKRIVAIGGDRVALHGGIPIINGVMARQMLAGSLAVDPMNRAVAGRIARERLPGEPGDHQVLDLGPTPQDEMPETLVPLGMVFVLGDNRDNSLDSRFPAYPDGVGPVAVSRIRGRPLFITRSDSRSRVGTPLRD